MPKTTLFLAAVLFFLLVAGGCSLTGDDARSAGGTLRLLVGTNAARPLSELGANDWAPQMQTLNNVKYLFFLSDRSYSNENPIGGPLVSGPSNIGLFRAEYVRPGVFSNLQLLYTFEQGFQPKSMAVTTQADFSYPDLPNIYVTVRQSQAAPLEIQKLMPTSGMYTWSSWMPLGMSRDVEVSGYADAGTNSYLFVRFLTNVAPLGTVPLVKALRLGTAFWEEPIPVAADALPLDFIIRHKLSLPGEIGPAWPLVIPSRVDPSRTVFGFIFTYSGALCLYLNPGLRHILDFLTIGKELQQYLLDPAAALSDDRVLPLLTVTHYPGYPDITPSWDPETGLYFASSREGAGFFNLYYVPREILTAPDSVPLAPDRTGAGSVLLELTAGAGVLEPAFKPALTNYRITVDNAFNEITLQAVPLDPAANVLFVPAPTLALSNGANIMRITVTPTNGTAPLTYTVTIVREILQLRPVAGGIFQRDSNPLNTSTVSAFRMGETEITRAQFSNVMGIDPSNEGNSTGIDDPVQTVTWFNAIAFCNRLSLQEALTPVYSIAGSTNPDDWEPLPATIVNADFSATGYRLPTEMEWMWAAMGGVYGTGFGPTAPIFQAGYMKLFAGHDTTNSIGDYAVFGYASGEIGETVSPTTQPPFGKSSNEVMLFDMSGNVGEWCWDWHSGQALTGPVVDYRGPLSGSARIYKGGDWSTPAAACAVAARNFASPDAAAATRGFRVVQRLP